MPRTPLLAAAMFALAGAVRPAEAQSAGPLALLLPVSARPAALGNAWVAGRDEYSVFYNPATASATSWPGFTFGAYGDDAFSLSTVAGETIGPTTIAWGVNFVNFSFPRT